MIILVSLIIFVAVLLILVVLAQNSKGGGLSASFGGSGAQQMIGVKRTSDLLEKITWGLAIAMLALSMGTTLLINNEETVVSPNQQKAQQTILPSGGPDAGIPQTAPLDTEGSSTPADSAE
jgi:preprotein translocase subunit SecG